MRQPWSVAGFILLAAASGACYPDRLSNTNYDAVITSYDTTASFSAVTYFLRDTVVHLVPPGQRDDISRVYDAQIIATVRQNMGAAGYISLPDTNGADLQVGIAASTTDYTGYYWNYWCDWWWGYYGCYYPPYWGTYSYTVGTLMVALGDRRKVDGNGNRSLIWMGLGNGVAGYNDLSRITAAINQMFTQSPYIKAH